MAFTAQSGAKTLWTQRHEFGLALVRCGQRTRPFAQLDKATGTGHRSRTGSPVRSSTTWNYVLLGIGAWIAWTLAVTMPAIAVGRHLEPFGHVYASTTGCRHRSLDSCSGSKRASA
jgi:hypothetical protein